jgi:hypothetical protein
MEFEPLVPPCNELLFLVKTEEENGLESVICCMDQEFEAGFLRR